MAITQVALLSEFSIIMNKHINGSQLDDKEVTLLKNFQCYGDAAVPSANRDTVARKVEKLPGGVVEVKNMKLQFYDANQAKQLLGNEKIIDKSPASSSNLNQTNVSGVKISTLAAFKENIIKDSYKIDSLKIEEYLTRFLESISAEDEGYLTGEVQIYFYKEKNDDVQALVAAGTKVLDALLFAAMSTSPEAQGLFTCVEVKDLTSTIIGKNLQDARRAIQAAVVLVYIQGHLPGRAHEEGKKVPTFIAKNLYQNEISSLSVIGQQLSCTSTTKFPAKVFLNVDINKCPKAVATRAKMSIAGNRGVRYAVFAGTCDRAKIFPVTDEMKGTEIEELTTRNSRVKLALSLTEFLRGISGKPEAQLRMHPLSPNKPVLKNLQLKITRAVIESLSDMGRMGLFNKIKTENNNAFLSDPHYAGEDDAGNRVWRILKNEDANFDDLSVATLKGIYGINN